jgi:putative holliday junction resolvase
VSRMAAIPSGQDAVAALPDRGRLLAVDLGDARIGLALSDPDQIVASPLDTIPAVAGIDALADVLAAVVADQGVAGVVVGYPRTLAGREGAAASRARKVATALAERITAPVVLWDERFTTTEAERVMIAQDVKRRPRRAAIDRVAASLILQGVLEARRGGRPWH